MPAGRDLRIDFFRGLALVFIFWDHMPDNVLGKLTLRNIGLSDAAEIFVFLAGYAAALAYGARLARSGYAETAMHVLRRAWVLYIAHVFVLVQLMVLVRVCSEQLTGRDLVQEGGLAHFATDPAQALQDGLMLRYMPGLMDALPLYMLLLLALAAILPALQTHPLAVLGGSFLLYVIAQATDWNLPAQPGGVWFFNPAAWQLLFFLGAVLGTHRAAFAAHIGRLAPALRAGLRAAAAVYLLVSMLLALSWLVPEWHDAVIPAGLAQLLYPIDKTGLSPMRLLHFLALAWLVRELVPYSPPWLSSLPSRALQLMGRQSLVVFCAGLLLAPIADTIDTLAGDGLAVHLLSGTLGALLLWAIACLPEWYRHERPAQVAGHRAAGVAIPAPRELR